MPQIMPTEVADPSALECVLPCCVVRLGDLLPLVGKDVRLVLTQLPQQQIHTAVPQRDRVVLAGLVVRAVNPSDLSLHVNPVPTQSSYIGPPQTRQQRELNHHPQVTRQFRHQPCNLVLGQKTHTL